MYCIIDCMKEKKDTHKIAKTVQGFATFIVARATFSVDGVWLDVNPIAVRLRPGNIYNVSSSLGIQAYSNSCCYRSLQHGRAPFVGHVNSSEEHVRAVIIGPWQCRYQV